MPRFEKSFYQVFECTDPNDYWSYDKTKVLFESDNVAHAHGYAYTKYNENNKSKYFVIIQPYDGSCRGGYGFTVEQNRKEQEMKYFIFKLEWSQTDEEMVIVKAESKEKASAFLKRNKDLGPRYVTYYGQQDKIIEVL